MATKKEMYDKEKVIFGLAVFVIILTFPFWYNLGSWILLGGTFPAVPEIKLTPEAQAAKECVMPKADMKAGHMQLLDDWRDSVVRNATRTYTNAKGKHYNMSLSNTCMDCHSNRAEFCDRCHNYASVRPYCWDCHIDNPKDKSNTFPVSTKKASPKENK